MATPSGEQVRTTDGDKTVPVVKVMAASVSAGQELPTENAAPRIRTTQESVDRTVRSVRRLVGAAVLADAAAPEICEIAAELEVIADKLESEATLGAHRIDEMWGGDAITWHSPVSGSKNAVAPPITFETSGDGVVLGTASLGVAYMGPLGYVHGGISALILDVALAAANKSVGAEGLTAQLVVTYHLPTPVRRELTIVGQHIRIDGRKVFARGEIRLGDQVCVSAEGLFVVQRENEAQ